MWGHDKTRGRITGVTFRDITVTGRTFPAIRLSGCDATHLIEDARFENLRIQGTVIKDAATARLETNAYVRGVTFVPVPHGVQNPASIVPEDPARSLANPRR